MTKEAILSSLAGAFMSIHGAPMVADPGNVSTTIPLQHIDTNDVGKRHPETIPSGKVKDNCINNYPC